MPLKTTNTLPPGGWVYDQKGKDGSIIFRLRSMSPFNEAATELLNVRKNNGLDRATIDQVREDIDNFQCERLGFDSNWCASKKNFHFSPTKLFKAAATHVHGLVEAAASRSSQVLTGIAIVKDWLGDGAIPVSTELSQSRADKCLHLGKDGGACPFNRPGFKPTEEIAAVIKDQVEKKNEMKLSVEGEESLLTCDLCFCHLPLKVHVPLETILNRTPSGMIAKFRQQQPLCWLITEQETPKN